jgi:hypothetical protein
VDQQFSDRRVASLLRFSAAGQYLGVTEPFSNGPQMERFAGDMLTYSVLQTNGIRLVVVGHVRNPATGDVSPLFRNYIVESSGDLTDATGVVVLDRGCGFLVRCQPEALAISDRGSFVEPALYIASRSISLFNPEDQRVDIRQVSPGGGSIPTWNPGNVTLPLSARTLSPGQVNVKALSAHTTGSGSPTSPYVEQVTVIAEVERDCGWGVHVARILNPSDFTYAAQLFGGADAVDGQCVGSLPESLFPRSAVRKGDTLIIAGRRNRPGVFVRERPFDAFITRLNTSSMTVQRQDTLTWPLVGPRLGNSLINDVLLDGNALIATGALRYPQEISTNPALEGKAQSSRMRLAEVLIFRDGFED